MKKDGQNLPEARLTMVLSGMATMLALASGPAGAAYLENQPTVLRQPDGTEVPCLISGDEFYHRVHDAAGYTIVRDPATGYAVYARAGEGGLLPTALVAGRDDPASAGLAKGAMPPPSRLRELRQSLPYMAGEGARTPPTGTINNLVVFVRFLDQTEFADSAAKFDRTFNNTAAGYNSLRNYFLEASYGATTVSSTFYPAPGAFVVSFQDTFVRDYYCPYDASTNPIGYTGGDNGTMRRQREHALLRSAINAIAAQVPAGLNIDADNDGYVDNICFVIRGPTTAWATLLWSHRWALYTYNVQINGKQVWDYNFQMETQFSSAVLCHEMGHSFGYPDLYHYYYGTSLSPTGIWDIMCSTPDPPTHSCSYLKSHYTGWLGAIPEITSPGTYWLRPLASGSSGVAYRIASPFSASEYFVLEYRRKAGAFDISVPGSGLLVFRINSDFASQGNAGYDPSSGIYDEVYLFRLNGDSTANGSINSAHFSSAVGRTRINDTTATRCFLHDGSPGGIRIKDIGAAGDSIQFTVTSLTGVEWGPARPPLAGKASVYFAPNPFRNAGNFSLNLPATGRARIAIYSVTGQLVRTVLEGELPSGRHQVRWDGRDDEGRTAAAGVYFFRLEAGGHSRSGRITVVR